MNNNHSDTAWHLTQTLSTHLTVFFFLLLYQNSLVSICHMWHKILQYTSLEGACYANKANTHKQTYYW